MTMFLKIDFEEWNYIGWLQIHFGFGFEFVMFVGCWLYVFVDGISFYHATHFVTVLHHLYLSDFRFLLDFIEKHVSNRFA